MTAISATPTATPESVWAALQESDRQRKENERFLTAKLAETDRQLKEGDEQMKAIRADYDRRMKKMEDVFGAWSNNQGAFAEEYFFNSFEAGNQNFFGEHFDEILKNVKGIKKGFQDEYDILLIN